MAVVEDVGTTEEEGPIGYERRASNSLVPHGSLIIPKKLHELINPLYYYDLSIFDLIFYPPP